MQVEVLDAIKFSSGFGNPPGRDNPGHTQTASSESRGRGQKILVVDDSVAWLRLAREILTAGGYQVHACEHAPDALSLFKENAQQFDLVITDLQMPCLDGVRLAAELLKINAALPVVLTSAAQVEMTSEKLQSLGIREFLTKPWERERLFSILQQILAHTRSQAMR